MIASSITVQGWLETIPVDRPVFVVAEGVFEYLFGRRSKKVLW